MSRTSELAHTAELGMLVLFEYEALTISRSNDVAGALVVELRHNDNLEVLCQLVSPDARIVLARMLSQNVMGRFTHGVLRVIQHTGGWLEVSFATWSDPYPVTYVPECLCKKLLEVVRPSLTH
jgi:hypothetical protein